MYFASPNCGEKFYLHLLLTIVKGPKSYKDLRTIDNVAYDTFKSACVARGLLEDDDEWVQCLQEAAIMKTGYQLQRLFCVILTQCSPLQPLELWKRFFINICDDLAHKIRTLFAIPNPTETHIEDYGLYPLNQMLEETSVDRKLRDIRDNPKPFGGITVVLGVDFRQILPVVPKGVREEIVNASFRHSDLWDDICVLTLNLNMRLNTTDPGNVAFANFLIEVGTNPQEVVHLPLTIGNRYTYLAADKMSEDDRMDRSITNRYPNEYLNLLDPTGLPPFKLELKVGCPIILLRNIASKDGLCNGTRMRVVRYNEL
ncbi:hypothetical protein RHGRI_028836 [Rhododendron griersonianum]|uniref:ATP-dependent DNA helicase n=1 Tax=Rhododendron griersonianum TaxID=479676 RepID=A0AAV6II17_9ERIC|nr:hypothetical protein RHGRI_028836 [Rhododendron griersonianum]